MKPEETFAAIIRLVPQWYQAKHGPYLFETKVADKTFHFFSLRNLTPELFSLWNTIKLQLPSHIDLCKQGTASIVGCLQESLVEKWLQIKSSRTNWKKIMNYVHFLLNRTCENLPVAVNIIIDSGIGTHDITEQSVHKFSDQIASSPYTYLRCDAELNFISYEEISWATITDATSYTYHPDFLHPFHCVLHQAPQNLLSIHVTRNRDAVIMNRDGIVAAKRKGEWRIYDVSTFKNSIGSAMGDYYIGANLFSVLFDLSFKRHGALLIRDQNHSVIENVVNCESILESTAPYSTGTHAIAATAKDITIGSGLNKLLKHKRLLCELASIDGAIIFDDDRILAVGAVIKPHPDVESQIGARTTAALSALKWGGIPAKVSSDGDVTIYFESRGTDGTSSAATMLFT